ncbi:Psi inducibility 4 [Hyphodiscus hymeniophilus]|uniref:Psi inducibility 4 n=1 Tax=Hyphodiscus hymeniophilus TaxID=353542 RepID=A0A9P6VH97_9HELO|nr:Psi inducibility 4 [Hyphodiscus hymeniophilus]
MSYRYDPTHSQDYPSRSPGTTRQPYGMGNLNRQTSRQFNSYAAEQPNLSLFTTDQERYEPSQFDRMTPQNEYHFNDNQALNSQTWAYNPVNGGGNTMGGTGRMKAPSARRAGIPTVSNSGFLEGPPNRTNFLQGWMNEPQMNTMPNLNLQQLNQHVTGQYSQPYMQNSLPRETSPSDDELIPTAIVIKNIPFAVKKEQLVDVMCDKGLPLPYAFNYHFDNGVFRGLAFANFTTPEETQAVITTLNHMDLNGRKLRVEYKKMLPAHERDRIERDKRERRGQLQEQHQPMNVPLSNNPGQLHNQGSMNSLNSGPTTTSPSPLSTRSALKPPVNGNCLPNSSKWALLTLPVDLNDPTTLSYYSELNLFAHDGSRDTLVFPAGIPPKERRDIHEMAQGMGLYHKSDGNGDNRHVIISKSKNTISPPVQPTPTYSWNSESRRGLARAATIDFSEARESGHYSHHTLGRQASDLLNIPGSPGLSGLNPHSHNLRAAKSFADLRSYTPSPVPSTASFPVTLSQNVARYAEYPHGPSSAASGTPNLTPTSGRDAHRDDSFLLNGMGSMNLNDRPTASRTNLPGRLGQERENYTSNAGPIGSQRPGNGVYDDTPRNGVAAVPDRQPRGPGGSEWGTSGFSRPRQNGHVNRGSGELDLNIITRAFDDNNVQDSSDRNGAAPPRY